MDVVSRPFPRWVYFCFASISILVAIALLLAFHLRRIDETTRAWVIRELSRRFDSQIELDSLHVQAWPRMSVKGQGLTVHYHNRTDVPPLIHIREFDFQTANEVQGLGHCLVHLPVSGNNQFSFFIHFQILL